ncbi:sulfite exporter TauE/SafE family protein [Sphingobacterium psychroaquaticum]|uniref:Probable membrane transporter protein n=1 Tax=Sphingobacterium psychroaquaticum TaxID=561061 RepID=A0A1X7J120_9SPHI|nr:sulfite exporter TauE/SafE family protein [Sphingobacterium psychroaquaticum]SMG20904.1 hypothetical protein SAMN05660862_1303 [Sphingobacterium psychroaquaticum]
MLIGFLLAIVVGATLGLVGSGGTILTVPILVYVMGVDPIMATTYSLFAIGITSFVGSVRGVMAKEVDLNKIVTFGIPSLLMVFVTRLFLLPLVPDVIVIAGIEVEQGVLLMVLFAIVMLASSWTMIKEQESHLDASARIPLWQVISQGLLVGLVTGTVGAGGGFLIIPALVNFYGMPIKRAVSTSLVIITINSLFGVIGDAEKFVDFDWPLILGYTTCAVIGIFIGFALSHRIKGQHLKRMFGYLILVMGIYIILREVVLV